MDSLLEDARIALRIILEQAPQLLVNGVDSPESIICCICLNEVTLMQTYARLPCKHILHFICFISEYSHRQRCPKCRNPIEISVSEDTVNATESSIAVEEIEYSNEDMWIDYDALTNFQTDFNPDLTLEIPLNSPNINIELSSNIASSSNTSHIPNTTDSSITSFNSNASRRRNPTRSARPTNLSETSVSSPGLLSGESVSAPSRRNRRIERLECDIPLIIRELNTVPNESFIATDLQSQRGDSSSGGILEQIYNLYRESDDAETNARDANHLAISSNFRFGTVLENRYAMLLPASGNDHNAREALNNEVEGLFPDINQSIVRRKIKRARVIYEIFNEIGVDKIYRITLPVSFFSELRREDIDNIISSCR
ncbi:16543_t:CDS:1 [Funneliformis mosseae]|uniref:16543_t:CDS:1 n=1 Tax=Funneliformis mosseae TaxID=27381 RepID=A0A9N9N6Q3_FUNMO|nr:16543_t:CDS:1 [Funneliformis mosseae]